MNFKQKALLIESALLLSLANAEMRLILTRVLFNFDMELDVRSENWEKQNSYLLWEKSSLFVKLTPK